MKSFPLVLSCLALSLLSACGGGGGGGGGTPSPPPSGPRFSLSASTLTFSAAKPSSPAPATQTVTANVTGGTLTGTLYVTVKVTGPAVSNVSNIVINSGSSGQATVSVVGPAGLGFGSFSSTITVTACLNDPSCATGQLAGSPATLGVTYNIGSSVETDVVAPRVVPAGASGGVILRGHGLSAATAVSFGSQPAQSFTVVNDSEIHATYPALVPGTYPISLNAGSIAFQAALTTVAPPAQAAASLSYPATVAGVQGLLYDAERGALFVAVRSGQTSSNAILRYAYVGGAWQAPTSAVVPELRDIVLSSDGTQLLAAVDVMPSQGVAIQQVDPTTLQAGQSVSVPESEATGVDNIVLANDGNAVVANGLNGGTIGATQPLIYSAKANTLTPMYGVGPSAAVGFLDFAGASGDGSVVLLLQGGLTTDQPILKYSASTGIITATNLLYSSNVSQFEPGTKPATAPSIDTTGDKIVLIGNSGCQVHDSSLNLLGTLPCSTLLAAIVRPDGTRAYTLDAAGVLHSFDLTASVAGGLYPEVGTGITIGTLGESETGRLHMAVSPDGGTLYVAGSAGVVVQPSPP